MKKHSWLAVLLVLALLFTACGPAEDPLPPPPPDPDVEAPTPAPTDPPAPGVDVELRIMWYDDGNEGAIMRDLLDRFEADNPGISVVMDSVAYGDLHSILQAQVEAGTPPDLARVTDMARFAGRYLDMRPYMTNPDAWASNWADEVLGSFRADPASDGLHGFPTQFTVTGPFVNRTLFEQAGVTVPSDLSDDVTWAEWEAAAVEVAEATGTPYAMAIDRTGHRFWGPSLSKCATYINPDGTFSVDTPGFRDTAQMIIDWHEDGITPLEVWAGGGGGYAAANEFFISGQLVFYMSGSWQVGQFADNIGDTFDWDVVPNPCGECGCTGIPGGAVMVAFEATDHPQEVTKLVEYLTSEDVLGEFSARSLFIPGHLGLAERGVDYESNKDALNVFVGQIPRLLPEAYGLQYHPQTFVLNTEIRDRLSQVIVGELSLDQAVSRIQRKMDEEVLPMDAPAVPEGDIELRIMWYDDGNEGAVMRDLLDRFEADYPNISVVMDTVAYGDLHSILQAQVEAGTPPDLARVTDMARFAGRYLDMRPYMANPNAWARNWANEVLNSFRDDPASDGLHGFPTQFTVTGPFVNRTLFEQAGVTMPSDLSDEVTWAEWEAAAVEVAEATGTPYAMAIDRTGHRFWGPSLSMCATYITEDGFEIDTPGFRDAAQMIIDWHEDGITPLEVWAGGGGGYAAANEFFISGQLVFYMSGSWQVGQFAENIGDTFDWDVVPNPCGDCGCTGIPGGAVLVAFEATQHPEAVTLLVEYLTRMDVLGEFSARSLFIPGHLGLADQGVDYESNRDALNVFVGQIPRLLPEAYGLQYHPLTFVLNTEIRDRLSQVIVGELTLDQAVDRIQQKMNEAVAEQ